MCATSTDNGFFNRKRPWSHVKDQVIGHYMPPYLRKVSRRGKTIVLVDAFAGPGVYEEDKATGLPCYGSPITMCREAEKHVSNKYCAFFGNHNRKHHEQLVAELENMGIPKKRARAVLVDSEDLLGTVAAHMRDETILLYLDPFGIKGCEWTCILPFLQRPTCYSTEIIINLNVSGLPRLAARYAVEKGRTTEQIKANHQRLTDVLGGEWWKEILWDYSLSTEEQATRIVSRYAEQLKAYYPYTGFCPVREKEGSRIKYFITFCSGHPDALILHNDNMYKAYNKYIADRNWDSEALLKSRSKRLAKIPMALQKEGVRQITFDLVGARTWEDEVTPDLARLDKLILDTVEVCNGRGIRPSRKQVWIDIIMRPDCFMKWLGSHYRDRVKQLVSEKKGRHLAFQQVPGKRLNDDSLIYVVNN